MRKLLVILAITLLPSFAMAAHGPGGHMSGGWGGHRMGGWHGGNWHHAHFFHHRPFVHRRQFLRASPPQVLLRRRTNLRRDGYGYDCWRWVPTAWGPRRIWVCGDYY